MTELDQKALEKAFQAIDFTRPFEWAQLEAAVCAALASSPPAPVDGWRTKLVDAAENVVIAWGMGWDMDGVIERLKAALPSSPESKA